MAESAGEEADDWPVVLVLVEIATFSDHTCDDDVDVLPGFCRFPLGFPGKSDQHSMRGRQCKS